MVKSRIAILDGFRALAILAVMLFHYFSRYTPPLNPVSLYPYKSDFDYFGWGKLGVQFFFIISGFVIFFTLEKTEYFHTFWKKRLIRLVPSIIIASIITFIVFNIFDTNNLFPSSHKVLNFIPSLTFINPHLLNNFLGKFNVKLDYINGAYWSLWPELQFYFLSSLLYYFNKKNFIRNFMIISILLITANYIVWNTQGSNKLNINLSPFFFSQYSKWIQGGFNLVDYLPFFSIGVLYYSLFKSKKTNSRATIYPIIYIAYFILFIIYTGFTLQIRIVYSFMLILFFLFIYLPDSISFFENKTLTNIGESSYFLYLIHENIGVLLIFSLGSYFSPFSLIFTLVTILILIFFSNLYTFRIDKKINTWLKKR